MKRIKIMILLISIFVLTGCSANYDVEIYNNTINEKVDITDKISSSEDEIKNNIYGLFEKKFGTTDCLNRSFNPYYDSESNYYTLRAETKFSFAEYRSEMSSLSSCCRAIDFSDDGKYITFKTLGYFKWFEQYSELDELNITIRSNHKVKEHNADETGKHKYIWHINKNNYKEEIPMIKLYSNKYVFNYNNEFVKKVLPIIIIVGIILGGGCITYLYFRNKSRKADAI